MEKGRWTWDDTTNQLKQERAGTGPSVHQLFFNTKLQTTSSDNDINQAVTLNDVKRVAIDLINPLLLKEMKKSSSQIFDDCYKTASMDSFLWNILNYFDLHLQHETALKDESIDTQGIAGDKARMFLKATVQKLEQTKSNLSASYIQLIAGLGMEFSHHSMQGRLRFSRTLMDRYLYEAIYEFTMLVSWVTFGYQHWDTIHSVLGSLLRTRAFNKDIAITSPSDKDSVTDQDEDLGSLVMENETDDDHLTWKVQYDRPAPGLLPKIRSPVMEILYPPPLSQLSKHKNIHIPEISSESINPSTSNVGIIGQPKSKFDSKTLQLIEDSSSSEEEDNNDLSDD